MARPLRIEYPEAWYHVTSRGNERSPIFRDNGDRRTFLKILKESLEAFRVELHCYVLMVNHFHFLLTTPLGNLSRFMQRLNTSYTVYFNRKHDRVGHLFQGRYKAILIDADSYLLELSRYIHLNPVRVGSVKDRPIKEVVAFLENYEWSSYRNYIGKVPQERFVHTGTILGMISANTIEASKEYRRFVLGGLRKKVASPLKDKEGQLVLGSPSFTKWVYKTFIEREQDEKEYSRLRKSLPAITIGQIATSVAGEFDVEPEEIIKSRSNHPIARQVLLELCCRFLIKDKKLKEIGESLGGISVSGLWMSRERLKSRLKKDSKLSGRFERIKATILS